MVSRVNDRWLWLGFGIFFGIAVKGIRAMFQRHLRLIEIHDSPAFEENEHSGKPEEAISLQTLKALVQHPNPNIANAAISIVISRYTSQSDWRNTLTHDKLCKQSSDELKQRAKWAQIFINDWMDEYGDANGWHSTSPNGHGGYWPGDDDGDGDGPFGHRMGSLWASGGEWTDPGLWVPTEENPAGSWETVPRERADTSHEPRSEGSSSMSGEIESRQSVQDAMASYESDNGAGDER